MLWSAAVLSLWKCHFDEIFITDCIGICHSDNFQRSLKFDQTMTFLFPPLQHCWMHSSDQGLSWGWRCSSRSANRRCFNYIWVINNCLAYWGVSHIRDYTAFALFFISWHRHSTGSCNLSSWKTGPPILHSQYYAADDTAMQRAMPSAAIVLT